MKAVGLIRSLLAWLMACTALAQGVVINEIMYHPESEDIREEFLELSNPGESEVDLSGWNLRGGVDFVFPPGTKIQSGGFLVVSADPPTFRSKYPGVQNVVGPWVGTLSNRGENLELDDSRGGPVDNVRFADEGDWSQRERGPLDLGHRGWAWSDEHDGLGKTLELRNPSMPNEHGQNWGPSQARGGSPGAINSLVAANIAPLIVEAGHFPAVPRSGAVAYVTARVLDEDPTVQGVKLFYRLSVANPGSFTEIGMFDDGLHQDGLVGDKVFGAAIPAQPNNSVVEFYIRAEDLQGNVRTYPAATRQEDASFAQTANLLYQVDDAAESSPQPLYKLIMTEAERAELAAIGNGAYSVSRPGESQSDAQMNGTFISIDASGTQMRYTVGIRNRGHGTRNRKPNNFRVNFNSDRRWKDVEAININGQYTHLQILGAVVSLKAGLAGAYSIPVQVRVNNQNLAFSGEINRTYGSYTANEVLNSDWAGLHIPLDNGGNLYRGIRDLGPANFLYRGEDKNAYTNSYFKATNVPEDDWTDLVHLTKVLSATNSPTYAQDVKSVIDVDQWLRHLAMMAFLDSRETGLNTGDGDDYFMYRGLNDTRFQLLFYDLDTIFSSTNATIFGSTSMAVFKRLLDEPEFRSSYYRIMDELIRTTFSAAEFGATIDYVWGSYVPASTINRIKAWVADRAAYVAGLIAGNLTPPPETPRAVLFDTPRLLSPYPSTSIVVGGTFVSQYKYKLNDGSFGPEFPVAQPLELNDLANGTNSLAVIGRTAAGTWQAEGQATVFQWVVDPTLPKLRINEVLASNRGVIKLGESYPDLVELYNEGDSAIALEDFTLTDDLANPARLLLAGRIEPRGFVTINAGGLLSTEGDDLILMERSGRLVDQVSFGLQLNGDSIGRIGQSTWALTQPTFGNPNVAEPVGNLQLLRINEWMTTPTLNNSGDYIEIFNPDSKAVALGGLYLSDQPLGHPQRQRIADLSFIGPGAYLAFSRSEPDRSARRLRFALSSDRGEIGLLDGEGRRTDSVYYGPQVSGLSEGRLPNGAPPIKQLAYLSPGAPNSASAPRTDATVAVMDWNQKWRYEESGLDPGDTWKDVDFDDSRWSEGEGLLADEDDPLPQPIRKALSVSSSKMTFYFRTQFTVPSDVRIVSLQLFHIIDDGAAFYLNGKRFNVYNIVDEPITNKTRADSAVGNAREQGPVPVPVQDLVTGENLLAVEVHQENSSSSDIVFGIRMDATVISNNTASAGLVLNEVLTRNRTLVDADGSTPDWVEIYNPSTNEVDLTGLRLTDDVADDQKWVFPEGSRIPARGYYTIKCQPDAPVSSTNSGFGLKALSGSLYLFSSTDHGGALLDTLTYGLLPADWSLGRVPDGSTNWTLNTPSFGRSNAAAPLGAPEGLRINEWMADPSSGADWFELYNPQPLPVRLTGLSLTDDLARRDKSPIPPHSYIGIGVDAFIEFKADDPTGNRDADHVAFKLSADGESIGLADGSGRFMDAVSFRGQAKGASEGRLPDGGANVTRFTTSASPASGNYVEFPNLFINEVLTHSDPPLEDAIEVYNTSSESVDLSGWYLSDDLRDLKKFPIPPGTVISPGGYKVFYEVDFNPLPGDPTSFSLSSAKGDQVVLAAASLDGLFTGRRAVVDFGPAQNGVSLGRIQTSVGPEFVPLAARTFGRDFPATLAEFRQGVGAKNASPRIGPIVIRQIMFEPPGDLADNTRDEFIELQNIEESPVDLFDPARPANGWRLRGGVDFDFPSITLAPGACLIVVGFDPANDSASRAAFEARYGPGLPLVGPWQGKLDNDGERITLLQPDPPQLLPGPDQGLVPFVPVEEIVYSPGPPWPIGAAGTGSSLQRADPLGFYNEPLNWLVAAPTPGRPTSLSSDLDGDGIPNAWEEANGLDPRNPADAHDDPDGDHSSNLAEFVAGTDPRNASDSLRIAITSRAEGVHVRFPLLPDRTYSLEGRSSIADGEWIVYLQVGPEAAARVVETRIPEASSQIFLRLKTAVAAQP